MSPGRSLDQGCPLVVGADFFGAAVPAVELLFQGGGAMVAAFGAGWGAWIGAVGSVGLVGWNGRLVGEAFLKDGIAIG